ncbi:MAG: Asp/Glu racemase [Actinomycetia bacterium]|nr:Asp/Glu racemase [Actinomycetes bacterium]
MGVTGPDLVPLGFETDDGFGSRARIGLIVLESDQTIEAEARMLDLEGVDIYHSRIPNAMEVTPATLTDMEKRLPAAAALLPAAFEFDAIGYGCTSAATLIGPDGVAAGIGAAHPDVACTNPISAAVAAFRALGAQRVAVVTPYSAEVTAPIAEHFAAAGLEVTALGSFLEPSDLVVGLISPASIASGVHAVTARGECDAVFVSCTSLRLLGAAADLEAEVDRPVVSSNMALFWHLLRLAGVVDELPQFGRLFTCPLSASAATED